MLIDFAVKDTRAALSQIPTHAARGSGVLARSGSRLRLTSHLIPLAFRTRRVLSANGQNLML